MEYKLSRCGLRKQPLYVTIISWKYKLIWKLLFQSCKYNVYGIYISIDLTSECCFKKPHHLLFQRYKWYESYEAKKTTAKNTIVFFVLDCCRITKASSHTSNAHEHQEEVHKSNIPSVKEDVASSTKLMTLIQTLVDLQV